MGNVDAMKVKMADLRHNSDIRRLHNKTMTTKDIKRIVKYSNMYNMLAGILKGNENV